MDFLTFVYLFYTFVALYFLFLFSLIYLQNRREMFSHPKITKNYDLSVVVPCYNEEESIGGTIQHIVDSSYRNLKKVFVVDDKSTDGSFRIIEDYARKYPGKVVALQTPKNTGKASGAKNYGARFVKTELIGFVDADSYPEKDAIKNMIGFFDNPKTGAVTSAVLVKKREKFVEKLQSIEYKIILFTRKLLGFVDAIYVTPGPLAVYRKKAFDEVNGFDESNMTEDIEITWNFVSKGYVVQMSLDSKVYTVAPDNWKMWFRQRLRWNVGGIQTINKYRKAWMKVGMLGSFILPFFVFSWILGITGLLILSYRIFQRFIVQYLSTTYSVQAQTAILTLRELNLTPSILVFFGTALLIMSLSFNLIALTYSNEKGFKKHGLINLLLYMFIYLLAYPFLLIVSIYKFFKGRYSW